MIRRIYVYIDSSEEILNMCSELWLKNDNISAVIKLETCIMKVIMSVAPIPVAERSKGSKHSR